MANVALAQGVNVGAANTDIYQTNPNLVKTRIDSAYIVSNDAGGPVSVDIWVTPDASTPVSNSLKIADSEEFQVGDGQTRPITGLIGQIINSGGRVIANASATGCSIWLNGRTFKTDV